MSALLITIGRLREGGQAALERYAVGVMPIIAAAGGQVISRGRPTETLVADGSEDGHPDLVAIIRFSSAKAIRTFLNSAEYRAYVGDRESAFAQLHSYIADDLIAG
jgi:uncharacterized protein (DUF1330 family)